MRFLSSNIVVYDQTKEVPMPFEQLFGWNMNLTEQPSKGLQTETLFSHLIQSNLIPAIDG